MARGTAKCTCKTCGKEFYRYKDCANRRDANSWEAWAVDHFDTCSECYKAERQAEEKTKGLTIEVRLNTRGALTGRGNAVAIIFGGDTMPRKDEIKALGARWTDDYPESNAFSDLLGLNQQARRWVLWADADSYEAKLEAARALGATVAAMPAEADLAFYAATAQHHREAEKKKKAELGPKPEWPEDIKALWPAGTKWNRKFYGKAGKWTVYFGGQKVSLTDDQKARMEAASEARDEWERKMQH